MVRFGIFPRPPGWNEDHQNLRRDIGHIRSCCASTYGLSLFASRPVVVHMQQLKTIEVTIWRWTAQVTCDHCFSYCRANRPFSRWPSSFSTKEPSKRMVRHETRGPSAYLQQDAGVPGRDYRLGGLLEGRHSWHGQFDFHRNAWFSTVTLWLQCMSIKHPPCIDDYRIL